MVKDLKRLVRVARGEEPADLVLKNGEVFHAFTGEFLRRDIAIVDGYVAAIGECYSGLEDVDVEGKYVMPGYIDAHVHIESSMLSPEEFAKAAIRAGVTTIIADPHEIANVKGTEGIQYMLDATENLPFNVFFMLPSCVPSTRLEHSGAVLTADLLSDFLPHHRVIGLAEMMNTSGVLNGDHDVYAKLEMAHLAGKLIDGHAPGLGANDIMAYASTGVSTDHECNTVDQAMNRLRAGMNIFIREGTTAKNLSTLLKAVNPDTSQFISFASVDKTPADMLKGNYINIMVFSAAKEGIPVASSLQIGTINTARHFRLEDIGAIAPGYRADINVFDGATSVLPSRVYKDGKLICRNGEITVDFPVTDASSMKKSVNIKEINIDKLRIPLKEGMAHVIGLIPYQVSTKLFKLPVKKADGCVVSDVENDVLKLAMFERHHGTGNVGLGLVKGFGLREGALASTVANDSHNLVVIGANDEDMIVAAKELERIGGGITVVREGQILGSLPLPIAGLMSDKPAAEVAAKHQELIDYARQMGVNNYYSPFMTLAFLSLPVVPALKLTDMGLVDVARQKLISVEAS